MEGPPLGPGGEDITWPDQVAPRGLKASSTRKIKPQTSNLVRNIGCGIDKAILDVWYLYQLVDDRVDFSYVHIRYFIGYVYHIRLQDIIQSTLSLCLLCQAMLLPLPLRPLLLTTRSGFS